MNHARATFWWLFVHSLAAEADQNGRIAVTDRYLNRELSWLDFNSRVMALAENPSVPLLERAKVRAIWSSNLDEFYQVRVSGLHELVVRGIRTPTPDGLTPHETLEAVRAEIEGRDRDRRTIGAKLVVGADGRGSDVARMARVPGRVRPHR